MEITEGIRQELKIERDILKGDAAGSFARFLDYHNPAYRRQWFHTEIARACQGLMTGRYRNLMVFMPPQHGKSSLVSEAFPAWALGVNPRYRIAGCSYAASLATKVSRNIQRIIDSGEYHALFPKTYLNGGASRKVMKGYLRTNDMFETVGYGGFYKAVGVGGGLTGTPVDIAIIDDPVKDAAEAYSEVFRERVWEWYTSVLLTRLHNRSRQLFIMTRWHVDDLAGRILEREADRWKVISIPAVRESLDDGNGFDPRGVGEALWPERHSLERMRAVEQRSPRVFAALYQQHPTVEGGNIIKEQWFGRLTAEELLLKVGSRPTVHFFVDTAYTEKAGNDPTGIIGAVFRGNDIFVTCARKVSMKFPELCRYLPTYVRSHGYTEGSTVRIEPKANGLSVIDQLREYTDLNVVPTRSPRESKETRLNTNSAFVESGHVWLVGGAWNEAFVTEVCGFPAQPHDEFVDLLCYAIDYLRSNRVILSDKDLMNDFI